MPRIFGYCRVSTQRQADKGDSLESQEASMRRVFELDYKDKGYALAAIVRDAAESGGKPLLNRPGGSKLSTMLEKGDVVLFPKLDRGFRNTADMLRTVEIWKQRRQHSHVGHPGGHQRAHRRVDSHRHGRCGSVRA
jgi:putative DNA-invertase from lambdoid prophage Rac